MADDINQVERSQSNQTALQEPPEEAKEVRVATGYGLHQVFKQDRLASPPVLLQNTPPPSRVPPETGAIPTTPPSFWNSVSTWWSGGEQVTSNKPTTSATSFAVPKPLDSTPTLDAPESIPADLQAAHFPAPSTKKQTKKWMPSEISDGLKLMSQHSIDAIISIICHLQLDLEKEHVKVADSTFSKYLQFQKMQQSVLQEIKDVLVKDENVLNYFKTAQSVTMAAGFLAGIAAAAMAAGVLVTAAAFIASTAGATVGSMFMSAATAMGTIGPSVT